VGCGLKLELLCQTINATNVDRDKKILKATNKQTTIKEVVILAEAKDADNRYKKNKKVENNFD